MKVTLFRSPKIFGIDAIYVDDNLLVTLDGLSIQAFWAYQNLANKLGAEIEVHQLDTKTFNKSLSKQLKRLEKTNANS